MKGKLIAYGNTGIFGMLEMCYKHNWNNENTILEHDGEIWKIYERIEKTETK